MSIVQSQADQLFVLPDVVFFSLGRETKGLRVPRPVSGQTKESSSVFFYLENHIRNECLIGF